ncbi:DNA helicase RecG [Candidatus Peregrinibacteria bacterium CG_4_10_14_0_2_um_filter_43_11]|nr:MAG: DNA helicase RecG [Candidatus Peregrinibacteria bacterium CG_4_10_14_0_2_um_filter_43_11]
MHLSTPLSEALSTKREYIAALREMELITVEDLLLYFPRTYEDLSVVKPLHEVKQGEIVTLKGCLHGIKRLPTKRKGFSLIKALFYDAVGNQAEVVWFNQPYLLRTLPMETEVTLAGKVEYKYGRFTIQSPEVELSKAVQVHTAGMVPVYPQHDVITSKWLREKINPLLYLAKEFEEFLPEEIVKEEKLAPKSEAVREIHFPTSQKTLERARDRLAYEELFLLQLRAVKTKAEWKKSRPEWGAIEMISMNVDLVKQFFSTLPFVPTGAQKVAIFEILRDMEQPYPMMRLLEGDVGSGKTLVAVMAILHAVKQGYQVAVMAPTSVLAQQHLISVRKFMDIFGKKYPSEKPITVELLTGSLKTGEKKKVQNAIANGQIDIIIGTHALVQEAVKFYKLGLVVIDEQHRFGVKQRELLVRQGSPHVLTMTATPIPRTLAIVAYGDQDLSVLNEMPPGRQPIETKIVPPEHRQTVYRFAEEKIKQGQQVYVICPLIDESDVLEFKSVKAEYQKLKVLFKDFSVEMLHGKLKPEEKEQIMRDFKGKKIDLLISTSVIEVGIDVPNATIMLIEGADRFGLSQLHQFRGRVGRGSEKSYCFLYTDSDSQATFTRLKAMVDHSDGFKLAEIDMKLRGPGEVYGIRQSGLPDLKIASLSNGVLVSRIRKAAEHLVEISPDLKEYPSLLSILGEKEG